MVLECIIEGMKSISIKEKLRMSRQGIVGVFARPKYIFLGLLFAFLFSLIIYFFINMNVYGSLLVSPLSLVDKLNVVGLMTEQMVKEVFTTFNGVLLLLASILQGVSISLMIYVTKNNKKMDAKALGSGGLAAIAATLGLGCVPCGTSIILPIMSIVFSSSAYAAANIASMIILFIAFFVSIYAIYKLGFVAFAFVESENLKSNKKEIVGASK